LVGESGVITHQKAGMRKAGRWGGEGILDLPTSVPRGIWKWQV